MTFTFHGYKFYWMTWFWMAQLKLSWQCWHYCIVRCLSKSLSVNICQAIFSGNCCFYQNLRIITHWVKCNTSCPHYLIESYCKCCWAIRHWLQTCHNSVTVQSIWKVHHRSGLRLQSRRIFRQGYFWKQTFHFWMFLLTLVVLVSNCTLLIFLIFFLI